MDSCVQGDDIQDAGWLIFQLTRRPITDATESRRGRLKSSALNLFPKPPVIRQNIGSHENPSAVPEDEFPGLLVEERVESCQRHRE